ncbi:acetate--CoA ligase [Bacteriovoracaceae bacterium]|nr:acetate--CoA ligase [Bacteriovoracaceae bacterium]
MSATLYPPPKSTSTNAWIKSMAEYEDLYNQSIQDPKQFWAKMAREELTWQQPFHTTMDCDLETGHVSWFLGGKINVTENCIDIHLPTKSAQTAIIWEGDEPGLVRHITYKELHHEVCKFANALKRRGIRKGDRVAIYMPMVPEAAYAMLACARIGAVHSVVFAGFSAQALQDRIIDAECKAVITADEGLRGGKIIPLKNIVNDALQQSPTVKTVFVYRRTGASVPMIDSRDLYWDEAVSNERSYCPPEMMNSEDILFLLYTSGSTGKPKGVAHASSGYLLYTKLTHRYVFDYKPGDIYACMADIGWVTGHSYIVYGPLANGATTFMFESLPTYPDSGRYWDVVERHKITQFYTAPTAIRAIAKAGSEPVKKYDRSSLRILGTVGEPINVEAWNWYYNEVGNGKCAIVDTWWQTETGGIMITSLPGATPMCPGAATKPFFGIEPVVLDEHGNEVQGNGISGLLAIKQPWPSMLRTVDGDHTRFKNTYLKPFPGYYFTGDGCKRDENGNYWITGRVDDVINVSGHRMGTAEVENALNTHPACGESAVVGFPHDIKGQGIFAYVILKDGFSHSDSLLTELKQEVRKIIGPIATPDQILIVEGLPKTRSGKIMRRILRKIASTEYEGFGDISTLADPSVVQSLIIKHRENS